MLLNHPFSVNKELSGQSLNLDIKDLPFKSIQKNRCSFFTSQDQNKECTHKRAVSEFVGIFFGTVALVIIYFDTINITMINGMVRQQRNYQNVQVFFYQGTKFQSNYRYYYLDEKKSYQILEEATFLRNYLYFSFIFEHNLSEKIIILCNTFQPKKNQSRYLVIVKL